MTPSSSAVHGTRRQTLERPLLGFRSNLRLWQVLPHPRWAVQWFLFPIFKNLQVCHTHFLAVF